MAHIIHTIKHAEKKTPDKTRRILAPSKPIFGFSVVARGRGGGTEIQGGTPLGVRVKRKVLIKSVENLLFFTIRRTRLEPDPVGEVVGGEVNLSPNEGSNTSDQRSTD